MPHSIHSLEARDLIIEKTLRHVPFEGWSEAALALGVIDAGFKEGDEKRAFDGEISKAVEHYCDLMDRRMKEKIEKIDLASMRVRDRIATAVMVRLKLLEPHKEAERKTLAYMAMPQHLALASCCLFKTVSEMWYAAGDTATDFNYYSKRALLAGVYASTLTYWLNDHSEESLETRAFLDRRISEVMQIEKAKAAIKKPFECLRDWMGRA